MDVLSEVLKAVKLDGAVFFNGEFSAPWCARQPDACAMASYLSASSKHVIIYHLVTEGRGYARVEHNDCAIPIGPGDIIIVPHGDAHLMGNGPAVTPMDSSEHLRQIRQEFLDSLEVFYNRKRRHAYLGYTSPVEFEKRAVGLN